MLPISGWLGLAPGLAQGELYIHLLLATQNGKGDVIAGAMIVHDPGNVLQILDRLTVYGNDQISAQQNGRIAEHGSLIAAVQSGRARLPRRVPLLMRTP